MCHLNTCIHMTKLTRALKGLAKSALGYDRVTEAAWERRNPFLGTDYERGHVFEHGLPTLGIIYDIAHEHHNYIQACHDLRVNYRVFDFRTAGWVDEVCYSNIEWFLAWPSIIAPVYKQFWDDRLHLLSQVLGKKVYPEFDALWIYESKRRTADWLKAHGYSQPETHVFFDREEALEFVRTARLPLVYKADQGAAAAGVYILRTRQAAERLVRRAFRSGISLKNRNPAHRHYGYVLFQEYLEDCKEWRLIRAGDSYFCRYKMRRGDFHSGSGSIVWAEAPRELLDWTRDLTETHGFSSLNIDFFETTSGEFLINELHALWGGRVLQDKELEGRHRYDPENGWVFEQGDFFRNRCANLRIEHVLSELSAEVG